MDYSVTNSLLDKRQSTLIKAMRFPLIVLVVIAHSAFQIDLSSNQLSFYHFVQEMISHNFCKIAVCWFFVFAGYFFFNNIPEKGVSFKWFAEKWQRRIRTLLIPFLFWNLLFVLAYYIKSCVSIRNGLSLTGFLSYDNGPLHWFIFGPANHPLWFIRDLMLMTLLAPLLFFLFKKTPRFIGITILCLLFLIPFDTPILTWRGYFFFALGTFLSIQKLNILSLCRKVKWPAAILTIVLLIIATIYNDSTYHLLLLRPFYPLGMISFMNICDQIIENDRICNRLCNLSKAVFFIYASHEIFIIGGIKDASSHILGGTLAGIWLRYFLVPIVVVCICLALYYILNWTMPRALAFTCGGRNSK